jgi:hypothetical protein
MQAPAGRHVKICEAKKRLRVLGEHFEINDVTKFPILTFVIHFYDKCLQLALHFFKRVSKCSKTKLLSYWPLRAILNH